MNKKKKWIITAVILVVFCLALGRYNLMNGKGAAEPDADAAVVPRRASILNVNGLVIRPQQLTDGITTVGNLLPDEEVDLSFETSGKIVAINFREGTAVKKGDLLAKVNDQPLLAQLRRYEAQLKLAEDRVYRQSALLEKDAVSQEAYEQARTELATLNADIDIVKSNIALTELRAPFDGVIGLRNVSEGAYASPNRKSTWRRTLSPCAPTTPMHRDGCCRAASSRCRSACTTFPTPSPCRPKPSFPRWAWTRSTSAKGAGRTPWR